MVDLYLASESPRRRELLQQIGVRFATLRVAVDETPLAAENPQDYVRRLALAKARAGFCSLPAADQRAVLGGDTSVVLNGRIFGKPASREEAVEMLQTLSGETHQVLSAVAVVRAEREACVLVTTSVTFKLLTRQQCEAYWETGEPADKAGAYGIQGLGGVFVESIEGSYTGVVGLPVAETAELLAEFGVSTWNPQA